PGKMYGLLVSVPARNGTPAWCIARTSPADLRYQPFIEAAASGGSFSDQYERKDGGMYLTRGSAVNFGSVTPVMASDFAGASSARAGSAPARATTVRQAVTGPIGPSGRCGEVGTDHDTTSGGAGVAPAADRPGAPARGGARDRGHDLASEGRRPVGA